jgi:hypothetical protein
VGEDKYDESAAAMIAQLKYGTGMPFYRLEDLEQNLGIPLPRPRNGRSWKKRRS